MPSKVVSIVDGGKKDDDECVCCGATPWHHIMRCPKVMRVELFEDGSLAGVEFFEPQVWQPSQ